MLNWRQTITSVSEPIFPGISNSPLCDHFKSFESESLANVPLQMSLYFNVTFLPVWIAVISMFLYEEYFALDDLGKFIVITALLMTLLTEGVRLYLGYTGNLRDKIPELAGFWILSILFQLPLQTFLLVNSYLKRQIVETVSEAVMYIMLVVQVSVGYFALKRTTRHQATHFKIMNSYNISNNEK